MGGGRGVSIPPIKDSGGAREVIGFFGASEGSFFPLGWVADTATRRRRSDDGRCHKKWPAVMGARGSLSDARVERRRTGHFKKHAKAIEREEDKNSRMFVVNGV